MALESELRVRWRLVGHADLEACLRLLPGWLQLERNLRDALPSIWSGLLHESAFNAVVLEDAGSTPGEEFLGLGMSIALDQKWQERLHNDPPPFVAAHVYRAILDGSFVPPSDAELGAMNAAGNVAFLALHYAQKDDDMGSPDGLAVLAAGSAAMRTLHSGYRLRQLFKEAAGAELKYLQNLGFRVYTRRAVLAGHALGEPGIPELCGLSREEAADLLPGTLVRDAFPFTPPVIGFSAAERRLLRLAVTDLPDERIAEELGLSVHTIKNLWVSIHRRVELKLPGLYQEAMSGLAPTFQTNRGPEKRRILIPYLRQRPEELRPWFPGAARSCQHHNALPA